MRIFRSTAGTEKTRHGTQWPTLSFEFVLLTLTSYDVAGFAGMHSKATEEIKPGDWFALGQIFGGPFYYDDPKSGTACATKSGVNVGVHILAAMDVASKYMLHSRPIEKTPSPFTANEILTFLRDVFEKHGMPRIGVLLSNSVWQSSTEMLIDDQVSQRAAVLRDMDIEIGPMHAAEKDKVIAAIKQLDLKITFDAEDLSAS